MACNDQLVIIYAIEVIVPGITSCPEPLYTCKSSFPWPTCHSRDDQVIVPQKVGGFHDTGFFTLEYMVKSFPMVTLSFAKPPHRCSTLISCQRCHTDDQLHKGVDLHALPNAIIPTSRSFPGSTGRHRCNQFPCALCYPSRSAAPMSTVEDDHDEILKHHVEGMQNPCPKYQQVGGQISQTMVLDSGHGGTEVLFNPTGNPVRTYPDRDHRCTEFPCPKCHGGQSQNAQHGVQRIRVISGSGLTNPEEVTINWLLYRSAYLPRTVQPVSCSTKVAAQDLQCRQIINEMKHVKIDLQRVD